MWHEIILLTIMYFTFFAFNTNWRTYDGTHVLFAATCFRQRSNSKERSVSYWFTFLWFHWIISWAYMLAAKVEKESGPLECIKLFFRIYFYSFSVNFWKLFFILLYANAIAWILFCDLLFNTRVAILCQYLFIVILVILVYGTYFIPTIRSFKDYEREGEKFGDWD